VYSLNDYDYDLPGERIAQQPAPERDRSRLLFLDRKTGLRSHHTFTDLPSLLRPSDVLVVNNTEVIPGRLFGRKASGGKVELLLLDYGARERENSASDGMVCDCLIKASKGPRTGTRLRFDGNLTGEVIAVKDSIFTVRFQSERPFEVVLYEIGHVPLPPYIRRSGDADEDRTAYQTVYASYKGAVAAPTAGLHFSHRILRQLREKGVQVVEITLHVGYGTFLPVRVSDIREHRMHSEWFYVSDTAADTLAEARADGRRIVAVGTTAVRTLEYAAGADGRIEKRTGDCDLFIYPGYTFTVVDAMVTNFHLPKSTLLMLVSAFAGREHILAAYREAIEKGYRFCSYGDAMLIA